jgi:nucleoside-diphosphate-sugar epimerase
MKVLFIGGTGNISSACATEAVASGVDLTLLSRGSSGLAPAAGARALHADIRDENAAAAALGDSRWDAVVNWVAYEPAHVEADMRLFRGRTSQYVFISSASAYRKPPLSHIITEATPLANPFWEYARKKIECEELLQRAWDAERFPSTIVRPSLTYGETWIPSAVGGHDYTVVDRMRTGRKVIVHGDGESLWTVMHNSDFARAFGGLLGNEAAVGEAIHITADEVLTWNRIYETIGAAAGVQPDLVHMPSRFIARFDARTGCSLLGDKCFSSIFDNSKLRRFVPGFRATVSFAEGIRRSIEWFDADPARRKVNADANNWMDRAIEAYSRAWPADSAQT